MAVGLGRYAYVFDAKSRKLREKVRILICLAGSCVVDVHRSLKLSLCMNSVVAF